MLIPFDYLFRKYDIKPKGLLHIGASEGQEAERYNALGIPKVIWVEAIPEVYQKLADRVSKYANHFCINACVGDVNGREVEFNISSNDGQSSSYLNFGTHAIDHPNVKFIEKRKMITQRVDALLDNWIDMQHVYDFRIFEDDYDVFDFVNIDLQGCELPALKSMGQYLKNVKWIYSEVNQKEVYRGCDLVDTIDRFLAIYGFRRVETKWTSAGWGDALFIKS